MSSVVRASQLAMVLLLGLSLPAQAQSSDQSSPLYNPEANSDPFSSRGDNNGAIMQLIHRAMRGESNLDRASEAAAQRESLSDAANDFFAKRNQLKKQTNPPMATPSGPGSVAPIAPGLAQPPATLKPATAPQIAQPITAPVTSGSDVTDPLTLPQPVKP